jgi:formylglycine-generating enzyme required for sulfatase activity
MRAVWASCVVSSFAAGAAAGVPDYDFQWATIGDPGNRAATQAEAPGFYNSGGTPYFSEPGRVDYTFRMATTEVTNAQYLDFLNAYRPHFDGQYDSLLTGRYIYHDLSTDEFTIGTGMENRATAVTWRMAARYTNWLHNGKGNEASDFETGVYDTSTFGRDPDTNQLTDQAERNPGSTFWIPTISEWTKGMYWDPDKSGGAGGYWLYHNGSDSPAIYDLPGNGGTSNAGTQFHLDVASYAATSPWGLFDGSGGEREMLENTDGSVRFIAGSLWSSGPADSRDRIGALGVTAPDLGLMGFRVAGVVPSPAGLFVLGFGSLVLARRRR